MKRLSRGISLILISITLTIVMQGCKKLEQSSEHEKHVDESLHSTDWPKEMDAMHAAPDNHKVLLENDQVRVLEVTVLPNETEAVHHHQWPSVLHITASGDFIRRDADGNVIVDSRKFKRDQVLPMTIWKEPQKAHSVENLSDSITIKLLRIELKN